MLSARKLTFDYPGTPVLHGVSLDLARGDFVVLRGESGCGKSTLLRLLCRLEAPSSGSLTLDGVVFDEYPATQLRRRIAYLQQVPVMLEGTVRETMLLSRRFAPPGGSEESDDVLRDMLGRARLGDVPLDKPARDLSVGQQQRLALLRLLLMRPDYLLLDEPTAALDAESASIILDEIVEVHGSQQLAVLLVTHAPFAGAPAHARWAHMEKGVIREGSA